jgi:hypothetical protein
LAQIGPPGGSVQARRDELERWRESLGRWVYRLSQANEAGALEVMASPARAMATQIRWQCERG